MMMYYDRIPDLTERYPEGFGGVDMCAPRDPEYDFWSTVDEIERQEREYFDKVNTIAREVATRVHGIESNGDSDMAEEIKEQPDCAISEIVNAEHKDLDEGTRRDICEIAYNMYLDM